MNGQPSMQALRDLVASEKAKQIRQKRIVDLLKKRLSPLSVDYIVEMLPDTNEDELAAMARLAMITYIPSRKYTAFK